MQPGGNNTQAPPPFKWVSPGAIQISEGGGCMSLFGVPFFLAGLFMIAAVTGVIHIADQPGGWGFLLLVLMSVAFTAVGGVLVFGRRWLTLDVLNRAAIRRQGLIVAMHRTERPLGEFNSVIIRLEIDSETPDRYRIFLRAVTGQDLAVCWSYKYEESFQRAEFLARFLQFPLHDTITDHEMVTRPEQVGQTFEQRLRSGGFEVENPLPPAAMRCKLRVEGDTTVVIPGEKSLAALVFLIAPIVLIASLGALERFFTSTQTPVPVQVACMGALAVMFGVAPMIAALNAVVSTLRSHTSVTASPTGLRIERRGPWRTKTGRVALNDIIDLDVSTFQGTLETTRRLHPEVAANPVRRSLLFKWLASKIPTKGLVVKTRRGLVTFGEGLPPEELEFLKRALLRGLTPT
jgi:hypothetical protein